MTIEDIEEDFEEKESKEEEEETKFLRGKIIVSPSDVAEVVALWTGVPVNKLTRAEADRFLNIEKDIGHNIIGQDDAVATIAKSLRRYASGLRNPKRPIGSFFLCGPTGVGKTELTKQLAEHLFGSQKTLIRLDMSEYMEKYSVSRLIGSPPGYVGHEDGGQLTEAVKSQPYSIVLFDEIEKAHSDVYNILLQILDDGVLSDTKGKLISFKNTLVILTSNVGAQNILDFCAKNPTRTAEQEEDLKKEVLSVLEKNFRPEFLNRLDDVVIFHPLTKHHVNSIAYLLLDEVDERLADKGYRLLLTSRLLSAVRKDGFNPNYGARPLRRAINKWVEDPISEKLLKMRDKLKMGTHFLVDVVKRGIEPDKPEVFVISPDIKDKFKTRKDVIKANSKTDANGDEV